MTALSVLCYSYPPRVRNFLIIMRSVFVDSQFQGFRDTILILLKGSSSLSARVPEVACIPPRPTTVRQ